MQSENTLASSRHTALHPLHIELGAKMVAFAGWHLPIQYPVGIMAEHRQCRESAALFDVSHMGQIVIKGDDATACLEALIPADLTNTPVGQARYSVLTDDNGCVIDDLIVTRAEDHWYLVVNASRFKADLEHFKSHLPDQYITVIQGHSLIALQGPQACTVISQLFPDAVALKFMQSKTLNFESTECRVSRLGYTGEDGFEIAVPDIEAISLCQQLLAHDACAPAGLGARDSLRLEAGLCLYGQDLDLAHTPVEAGLGWTIAKRRREDGNFPGAAVILEQLANKPASQLIGIKPDGRVPARQGTAILNQEKTLIGLITSGGFSPTLQKPIAMGYVQYDQSSTGTEVLLEIRGKLHEASLCDLPFVPHQYQR